MKILTSNLLRACQVPDTIPKISRVVNSFTPHYNISQQRDAIITPFMSGETEVQRS